MEHRKDYGSPRDMLDDALLQRVLSDMANADSRRTSERSGCGCQRDAGNNTSQRISESRGCGCRNAADPPAVASARQSCGCSRNRSQMQSRQEIRPDENGSCPEDSCIAGRGVPALQGYSLAMVYAPNQDWEGILEPEDALAKGTLFSGLLFPWYPSRCHDGRDCGCGRD